MMFLAFTGLFVAAAAAFIYGVFIVVMETVITRRIGK